MLVANKTDLISEINQVLILKAKEYATKNGLIHVEASAKSGNNVSEIF